MKEKIAKLISEILNIDEKEIKIEIPKNNKFGDYSTNIAMQMCKIYHKNPMEIASDLQSKIKDSDIVKIEVVNPGFINFFVNKNYLLDNINKVIKEQENYGRSTIGNGQKINLEFVSANPTGILHLGNARGGAYGDNMARIYKFAGYKVNKEYYINDAGMQINNLGLSLQARYLNLCGIKKEIPLNGYHGDEIVKIAKDLYEEVGSQQKDANVDFFKNLGIEKLLDSIFNDLKEFRVTYDTYTSEKKLYDEGLPQKTLEFLIKNSHIYEQDGALWFKATQFGGTRDIVLVKKDKEYTYTLPDIAHHIKTMDQGYTKLINVLGADHHGYISNIKSGISAMGYDSNKLEIKLLQLVKLIQNGQEVKMSKRTGKSVSLHELIEKVGVNAARYFFAMRSLDTQMDFDIDLATKKSSENPVYYISYAYARICSILKDNESTNVTKYVTINNNDAYNVLKKVFEFKSVVENAAKKELPHLVATYAYDLANLFHIYYSKNRIITDNREETNENLNMINSVKITLANALNLIGVIPPERM